MEEGAWSHIQVSKAKIWRRRVGGSSLATPKVDKPEALDPQPPRSPFERGLAMPTSDTPLGAAVMADASQVLEQTVDRVGPARESGASAGKAPSLLKMGLVVTASALCGGIAVVLWNRRLLTRLREIASERAHGSGQGPIWEDDL